MRLFTFILLFCFALPAAQSVEIIRKEITIKDHKFSPDIIEVEEGSVIKLKIVNLDETIEEFESFDLKREKIVAGNGGKIIVTVGPLKPGEYVFFGEFNPKTAQGKLIVKEKKDV